MVMERLEEEDTYVRHHHNKLSFFQQNSSYFLIGMGVIIGALAIVSVALGATLVAKSKTVKKTPKNIIFMIGDGFGPASQTFARVASQRQLALDTIFAGTARTFSSDSHVTDSAAGATAYSCNKKTYNNAVGVDPQAKPCGTLLEAAMFRGMTTAIVVTSDITDATPAAFTAHVPHRRTQPRIALQQIQDLPRLSKNKWGVDIMLGGGLCQFVPSDHPNSCRTDSINLVEKAKEQGYKFVQTRQQLEAVSKLPVLGLFNNKNMKYVIDRSPTNETEPTLLEMTKKALALLKKSSKSNGFFMLIEGSRIDHAGHKNDISSQVHEVTGYNDAVQAVLDFAAADGNTLVISTADHETGGLTLGRALNGASDYVYNTDVVYSVKGSVERIATEIIAAPTEAKQIMSKYGIPDVTDAEVNIIFNTTFPAKEVFFGVGEVVNRRAHIGWSTGGHTGVDVNVYAYGVQHENWVGNQDNTDVGKKVTEIMSFDLDAITKKLNPS